jgi:DHA2 family multidrug resistance protein
VTGLLMIVTATLLPPFLQQLKGYPVFTTGVVMAPRGIGTMLSMFAVSRMIGRVDARHLIALGLALCAISLYDMTQFSLDISEARIVWNGFLQGLGLGLVFPPLTTLAFATIPARIRTEGAALNALMRNLGASIGVATLVALLGRNIQINHSTLAENLTPFNPLWRYGTTPTESGIPIDRSHLLTHMTPFGGAWPYGSLPTDDFTKLTAMWGEELNRQASMIAYLNDFRVLALSAVLFIPLLFFMRRQAGFARPTRR